MAKDLRPCSACGHARELHGGAQRNGACRHGGETHRCTCSRFATNAAEKRVERDRQAMGGFNNDYGPGSTLSRPEVEEPCAKCGHARERHVGFTHTGSCDVSDCTCTRWKRTRPGVSPRTVRSIALTSRMHDVLMRALHCASAFHTQVAGLNAEDLRKLTFICKSARITEIAEPTAKPEIWKSPPAQGSRYYQVTRQGEERMLIAPWSLAHDRRRLGESSWNATRIPPGWIRVDMPMGDPQRGEDPDKPSRSAFIGEPDEEGT